MEQAILTNDNKYVVFKYGDKVIRYRSPYSLEYFDEIKKWDNGYIVVMTKYKHDDNLIEEYIDLGAILDDLCIDKEFLKSIRKVIIEDSNYGV